MAATKKVAVKKTARKRQLVDDGIYWVVSERKLLTWTPLAVFKARRAAEAQAREWQDQRSVPVNMYKVDRVVIFDTTPPAPGDTE